MDADNLERTMALKKMRSKKRELQAVLEVEKEVSLKAFVGQVNPLDSFTIEKYQYLH